ncbi:MAG: hypothetical protein RMJ31_02685 [Nitrososphaerota archaeon]|nr:hypothetical protein [Nitrososphaerales archaeon]MDW8044664.1 hypothetical protein [Nitrososphaerota archaeon]
MDSSTIKRPIAGFVLSLISGIFILINAILFTIFTGFIHTFILTCSIIRYGVCEIPFNPPLTFISLLAILGLVCGMIILLASYLTYRGRVILGGLLTLTFSILSIVVGGGFLIGMILGIIGGVFTLARI